MHCVSISLSNLHYHPNELLNKIALLARISINSRNGRTTAQAITIEKGQSETLIDISGDMSLIVHMRSESSA